MNENVILFPAEDAERRRARSANVFTFLCGLDVSKQWEVIVRPFKKSRSNRQNRYLNGVAYKIFGDHFGWDRDDVSEHFCGEYFGWKIKRVPPSLDFPEGLKRVPVRTTTIDENGNRDVLKRLEFCDYVAFVQRYAAERGVYIPDPDPDYYRHREQKAA